MRGFFLKDASAGMQFLFVVLVVISAWLIFQVISLVSGLLIFNIGFFEVIDTLQNLDNPKSLAFLKYVQGITSFGMFVIAALISVYFISDNPGHYLLINRTPALFPSLIVIFLILATLPMNNYFSYINGKLNFPDGLNWLQKYFETKEGEMENIMVKFLTVSGTGGLLINILIIAIIPAIGEEFLFRGVIQNIFAKGLKNSHYAVILTALLFAALHFQFLSILPRFVLGIILGYIYLWTGNLWLSVLAHFVNNGVAVFFYFYYYSGQLTRNMDEIGTPGHNFSTGIVSIVLVSLLLFVLWKLNREEQQVDSLEWSHSRGDNEK